MHESLKKFVPREPVVVPSEKRVIASVREFLTGDAVMSRVATLIRQVFEHPQFNEYSAITPAEAYGGISEDKMEVFRKIEHDLAVVIKIFSILTPMYAVDDSVEVYLQRLRNDGIQVYNESAVENNYRIVAYASGQKFPLYTTRQ